MRFSFGDRGIIMVDDAQIRSKNFSGEPGPFNKPGDRNFLLVIDDPEIAEELQNDVNEYGVPWPVKIKPPVNEDDAPFMYMPVNIKWTPDKNDPSRMNGPKVTLESGGNIVDLDDKTIGDLDRINISYINADIRPYDGVFNGRPFRTAYVNVLWVKQETDRFQARRAQFNRRDGEELPFL